MKLAIIALALVFATAVSANFTPTVLNASFDYYAKSLRRSFYNSFELFSPATAIGVAAESAVDPAARDHVIVTRGNYQSYILAIEMSLHDARENVVNNILAKQDWVAAVTPDLMKAMMEFDSILREKECDYDSMTAFFSGIRQGMDDRIVDSVTNAMDTYNRMMRNGFIPIHMVQNFFEQINSCFSKVDGLACLMEKEELYQRSTLDLVRQIVGSNADFLMRFNDVVAEQIYKGIGQEIYKGYTTVWNYPCGALT